MENICRICGHQGNFEKVFAREMMFGIRDEFCYLHCEMCYCLQIIDYPKDMTTYYPSSYYAFHLKEDRFSLIGFFSRFLRKKRAAHQLGKYNLIGNVLEKMQGELLIYKKLRKCKVDFSSRILDIGCGEGKLLRFLHKEGFSDLVGIDPYTSSSIVDHQKGLRIYKQHIDEHSGKYDLIILSHVLEHMSDQEDVFRNLIRLCKPSGHVLISIPLVDSEAWAIYRQNWVQLDPPRHFYIHSRESISLLAKKNRFAIFDVEYDSTAFQFWGSEQNKEGIALYDENSYLISPQRSRFSAEEVNAWSKKAEYLNSIERGDQATFYLSVL